MKAKVLYLNSATHRSFNFYKKTHIKKMKSVDLLCFLRSVSEFLKINSDIVFCLESSLHSVKKEYKKHIKEVILKINQGESFSSASSDIFPQYVVRLIKLGEKNNSFQETFDMLKNLIISKTEQNKKLINSLFYPVFTLGVFSVVLFLFSNYIMPSIFSLITTLNPESTNELYLFDFFIFSIKSLLFVILGSLILFVNLYLFKTKTFENLILKIPVLGNILKYNAIAMISYYIFSCLKSGLSIIEALNIVIESNSGVLKEILCKVKSDVIKGSSIYSSLKKASQVPDLFVNTLKTGEQTSNITDSFLLLNQIYQQKYNDLVEKVSTMLPVLIIFFVSILMIFFVFLVFMPIYSIGV